jgi:hypothetical protein
MSMTCDDDNQIRNEAQGAHNCCGDSQVAVGIHLVGNVVSSPCTSRVDDDLDLALLETFSLVFTCRDLLSLISSLISYSPFILPWTKTYQ